MFAPECLYVSCYALSACFFFVAGAIVFRLVTTIMPCRLVPCDLGDPGGDPWFPHGTLLLYSLAGYDLVVWVFLFGFVVLPTILR